MRVKFKIPRGDTVQGEVIGLDVDKDTGITWTEVRLDAPITQMGLHGNEVTQAITEVKLSEVEEID